RGGSGAYTKGQQSQRSVAVGREILERDLARHQLDLGKLRKDGTLERVLKELGVSDEEALLADVGYGKLTGQQVLAKIFPEEELERRREQKESALQRLMRLGSRPPKSGRRVAGVGGGLGRLRPWRPPR